MLGTVPVVVIPPKRPDTMFPSPWPMSSRLALDLWRVDRQFGKDAAEDSAGLPAGIQTHRGFESVTKVFEVGDATPEARLPFEEAYAHPPRREQRCGS